jgi:hypothetical protein
MRRSRAEPRRPNCAGPTWLSRKACMSHGASRPARGAFRGAAADREAGTGGRRHRHRANKVPESGKSFCVPRPICQSQKMSACDVDVQALKRDIDAWRLDFLHANGRPCNRDDIAAHADISTSSPQRRPSAFVQKLTLTTTRSPTSPPPPITMSPHRFQGQSVRTRFAARQAEERRATRATRAERTGSRGGSGSPRRRCTVRSSYFRSGNFQTTQPPPRDGARRGCLEAGGASCRQQRKACPCGCFALVRFWQWFVLRKGWWLTWLQAQRRRRRRRRRWCHQQQGSSSGRRRGPS